MALTVEQALKSGQRLGKALQAAIADKSCSLGEIGDRLAEYRITCDTVTFLDFRYAQLNNIEAKLWDAHGKVNSRFRKHLSRFRDGEGKKKPVEQRKAMKQYLEFIKSSQRFYRSYIQKLAVNFGGIHEVEAVAGRFSPDSVMAESRLNIPAEIRTEILLSCHRTLVRLGDLSRYRETELVSKDRNWGPAIGYYDLAGTIRPSSGASHNQLAVIALADGSHLRATYHLYRALAVEESHPNAKGNLEIEFKKIITAWDKGELINASSLKDSQGSAKALLGWFMRLHARCYRGIEFAEHDELESEVLSQLAIELKERSLEATLHKFVLINIAAEYFASVRLQDTPESVAHVTAFFSFQRLNVKTFFTLLQVLQPELERFVTEDVDETENANSNASEKVTAVARRVWPGLRHYSSWLMSNKHILIAGVGDASHIVQIKELWKIYANTLTLLAATFPVSALPSIDYLLEEDEDTLGFKPFDSESTFRRFRTQGSENFKPRLHDKGVDRQHPNIELLGIVRDFLTDGLELALDEDVPVDLIDGTTTFSYREEGMPSESLASPEGRPATLSSTSIQRDEILDAKKKVDHTAPSIIDEKASESASVSMSVNLAMNRMVDDIVGSETTNAYEVHEPCPTTNPHIPQTPPGYSFDDSPVKDVGNETNCGIMGTLTANDLVRETRNYSPHQAPNIPSPLLPSLYNSAFAPTPDDNISSRPATAKGLPLQQPNGYNISSSTSIMKDPSSVFSPQQSWNNGGTSAGMGTHYGVTGRPSTTYGTEHTFTDGDFISPVVFNGSPLVGSSTSGPGIPTDQTPPNGQYGG